MKDWFWKKKTPEAPAEPTTIEGHRSQYLPYTITDAFKLKMGKSIGVEELSSLVNEQLFPEATYLILKALKERGMFDAHRALLQSYLSATDRTEYQKVLRVKLSELPKDTRVEADKLTQLVMYGFDAMQENFKTFFTEMHRAYSERDRIIVLAHAPLVGIRHLAQVCVDGDRFVILTGKDSVTGYTVSKVGTEMKVEVLPAGFVFPQSVIVADDFTRTGASFQKIRETLTAYQPGITIETRAMIDTSKA